MCRDYVGFQELIVLAHGGGMTGFGPPYFGFQIL